MPNPRDPLMTTMQRHVMIDLETLGTGERAHILSIGAVSFDASGIIDRYYVNVGADGQNDRDIDADTVRWWMQQSDAARAALINPAPIEPHRAAAHIANFIHGADAIWAYPASFDLPILHTFIKDWRLNKSLDRRKQRCARTVLALAEVDVASYRGAGTHHNALDDAEAQARALIEALRVLAFNWEKTE